MQIYKIRTGDSQPISIQVLDEDTGDAISLTSATARFIMVRDDNDRTAKVKATAEIYDAANGKVRYNWSTADLDTPGTYYGFFEITYSGGKKQTIPADNELKIVIIDDWE